jgi:hypothetical protein
MPAPHSVSAFEAAVAIAKFLVDDFGAVVTDVDFSAGGEGTILLSVRVPEASA